MPQTENFLAAILPETGIYCAAIFSPRCRHVWCSSISELARTLEENDKLGFTVYHANASFMAATKRTAANAFLLRSFFLDLDCGEGKPYANQLAGAQALAGFCQQFGLPWPIMVNSGHGVHAYWPLTVALTPAVWLPYAEGLKALCRRAGLAADPVVTTDVARILRPVGTMNRKTDPKPVTTGQLTGPFEIEMFAIFLAGSSPSPAAAPRGTITDAMAQIYQPEPTDAEAVADRCPQLQAMRATGGQMSEPEWKACLGVLAFCDEGAAFAHQWSKGDSRYAAAETQDKFERAARNSGPSTCDHFGALNGLCRGCPHKGHIASPVQLGRGKQRAELVPAGADLSDAEPLPALIEPFVWGHNGELMWARENADGVATNTVISHDPIYVSSYCYGEKHRDSYAMTLRTRRPHEGWREFAIDLETFHGPGGMSKLAGMNFQIHDSDWFRRYVMTQLHELKLRERPQVQYEQFGWKEDETAFLWGNRLYRIGQAPMEVNGSASLREKMEKMRPGGARRRGSLIEWSRLVDTNFAPAGYEKQMFAVMASAGAIFMQFLSGTEGGAIIHLQSRNGGKGKSTAMEAAASIWGDPEAAQLSVTDTVISQGSQLAVYGNLPCTIDEFVRTDPEKLREFIQRFTNGRDRRRALQSGALAPEPATWRTMLITTSNTSVLDTVIASAGSEALSHRVIELPLQNMPDFKEQVTLKRGVHENTGWVGEAILTYLMQPDILPATLRRLQSLELTISGAFGFKTEQRFWTRTLTCAYLGGEILHKLGLITAHPERVIRHVGQMLSGRAVERARQRITAPEILSAWLQEHVRDVLVVPHEYRVHQGMLPIRGEFLGRLLARHELNTNRILIDNRDLRTWVNKYEYSYDEFIEELEKDRIVTDRRLRTTLSGGVDKLTSGQVWCVVINGRHRLMQPTVDAVAGAPPDATVVDIRSRLLP